MTNPTFRDKKGIRLESPGAEFFPGIFIVGWVGNGRCFVGNRSEVRWKWEGVDDSNTGVVVLNGML